MLALSSYHHINLTEHTDRRPMDSISNRVSTRSTTVPNSLHLLQHNPEPIGSCLHQGFCFKGGSPLHFLFQRWFSKVVFCFKGGSRLHFPNHNLSGDSRLGPGAQAGRLKILRRPGFTIRQEFQLHLVVSQGGWARWAGDIQGIRGD